MRTPAKRRAMTLREKELYKRCIILMIGSLLFFMLAAIRAHSADVPRGQQGGGRDYRNDWSDIADEEYDIMSDDDHMMAARLTQRVAGGRPTYNRRKSSRVHDSVTIVVNENTTSELSSSNDLKGDSSNSINLSSWLTGGLFNTTQRGEAAGGSPKIIDYSSTRKHKSDSSIDRYQALRTTLTGKVIDVQPNGYLVIEARKTVNVNGEEQIVILTGIVNPDHLDSDSRVDANKIIDMYVRYSGSGPMTRMDKRGWMSKTIDFLKPF